MTLLDVLRDVRLWEYSGIILALIIGFDSPHAGDIIVIALIAQMAVSLDGIQFKKDDFSTNRKGIIGSFLASMLICSGTTLLTGLFFYGNEQLWTGWVMLASVPCAISVVVCSLVMKGDTKLSVLSLTVIYVLSLAITPIMTRILLGNSADPMEVLEYIVLFIVIPFSISFVLRRFNLRNTPKTLFINLMLFVMVFIGLGIRRDYIFQEPEMMILLIIACLAKLFIVSYLVIYVLKRFKVQRDTAIVYMVMSVWKNSGMAMTLVLAIYSTTMPDAVLPCMVSFVLEGVWFAVMSKRIDRIWPIETKTENESLNAA